MTLRKTILAACAVAALSISAVALAETPAAQPDGSSRPGSTFTVNGDTIFYQEAGTGPDLLLIHGFPLSGALFARQLDQLSATFHVIVVDLPGFGMSTSGTNQQTDTTYAADLFALLAHLNVTKVIVGGHSMGGQITLEMYAQNPTMISGMILFDTNPNAASIIEQHEWPGYAAMARMVSPGSLAPALIPVMVTGHSLAQDPALGTKLTTIVTHASVYGIAGGVHALVTRPDFKTLLGTISVPTLVMVGEDDPLYPVTVSKLMSAAIPNATLMINPYAGHASMFQRPAQANASILHWARTSGLTP